MRAERGTGDLGNNDRKMRIEGTKTFEAENTAKAIGSECVRIESMCAFVQEELTIRNEA
jgi:hypothetical protein